MSSSSRYSGYYRCGKTSWNWKASETESGTCSSKMSVDEVRQALRTIVEEADDLDSMFQSIAAGVWAWTLLRRLHELGESY